MGVLVMEEKYHGVAAGAWTKRRALGVKVGVKHFISFESHENLRFRSLQNGIGHTLVQSRSEFKYDPSGTNSLVNSR